jgi:AcrR family transcriptional regulator
MSGSDVSGRRADATFNRQAILAAALTVLGEDPRASLTTIAAAAGVAPRTLYGHFASRDDLTEALAASVGAELTAHVTAIEDGPDPVETLARFVQATSAFNARFYRMRELVREPGAREHINDATVLMRQRLHALIERANAASQLTAGIDAAAAVHLVAALQWAVYEALTADDLTAEQAPQVAVKAILGALGAPPKRIAAIMRQLF